MKNRKNQLKIVEIALALGLCTTLLWGANALQSQKKLADKVIRLHVIANSDSEEDQALKLLVRDRVLSRATEILESSGARADAEQKLTAALPDIEAIAAQEIAADGYRYAVKASLAETDFPTKEYEGFLLPAGNYLALRIVIGEGDGRNWWCVVFPPLCTTAVSDMPQTALNAGLSEEEVSLMTEEDAGYVLKFKSIELWEKLQAKLKK